MRLSSLLFLLTIPALVACVPIQAVSTPTGTQGSPAPLSAPRVETPSTTNEASPTATGQPGEEAAASDQLPPKAALERLFSGVPLEEAWFATSFLAQVPIAQIEEITGPLAEQLGTLERIEGENSPFTLVFTLGTVSTEIYLDGDGRIVGLFFHSPTPIVASLDEAIAMIEELSGEVNVLVTRNGEEIAALDADTPLGVGSAFKLEVLTLLRNQIEVGSHAWDEVVPLEAAWKGLPSSLLMNWPDDSPVTLHTLATLMISISDNTATDALIDIVGRDEIEAVDPRNRPFLKTQELFKLKSTPNAELLEQYRNGDETDKRQVVEALADLPLPTAQEMPTVPVLDVEWFFTAYELCDWMAQVQDLDLMTVEPGPAATQANHWARIAFKGGSELGVLNLTTWLEAEDGTSYCVTMTQNNADAPVNEAEVTTLYQALLSMLQ
jgi:hypothetical protein